MVAFLLALSLDSAECMGISMFYNLMSLGAKAGDSVAIRFVGSVDDAFASFKADPKLDVLLFQSGELSLSPASMLDYMYKDFPVMTLVHPLPRIAWDKVASGVSMGSTLHPSMLGLDYNVPLTTAQPSPDPDVLLIRKPHHRPLTNFKVTREGFDKLQGGTLDAPIAAYIKETAGMTGKRAHTGCIADRCFIA